MPDSHIEAHVSSSHYFFSEKLVWAWFKKRKLQKTSEMQFSVVSGKFETAASLDQDVFSCLCFCFGLYYQDF